VLLGGVQLTVAEELPATAVTALGAEGAVNGMTALVVALGEVPTLFCAVTLKV
jgi:hypothetical protein